MVYSGIMDTIRTSKRVFLIEVSFVKGSFNIIKAIKGTRSVHCSEVSFIQTSEVSVPLYNNMKMANWWEGHRDLSPARVSQSYMYVLTNNMVL